MEKKRSKWASGIGFVLAAAGSAVGVGNIWKFPGKVGAYGGGVFLLTYFIVVVVLGLVLMLGELALGRHTEKNVVGAFASISKNSHTRISFISKNKNRNTHILYHAFPV